MLEVRRIPGTIVFDGAQAMKGYALNRMCYSFNRAENRKAFLRDEEAYMEKFKSRKNAVQRRQPRKNVARAPPGSNKTAPGCGDVKGWQGFAY